MRVLEIGICAVLVLLLVVPLPAQSAQNTSTVPPAESSSQATGAETSPQAPAESAPTTGVAPAGRRGARPVPCWREAGIAPAAVNQRWRIEDAAKGRINQVCTDVSLSPEQKRDRIRQINKQTEQEVAKIIPAKQLETFKACQAERDREIAKRPGKMPQRELGPCGGVIPAPPAAPQHSHGQENPPSTQ